MHARVLQDAAANAAGTAWQHKFDIATRRFVSTGASRQFFRPLFAFLFLLKLLQPTSRSLPGAAADDSLLLSWAVCGRRTILWQNSRNKTRRCARRSPLVDTLTTVALPQECLRGSFLLCWLHRKSVRQIVLHGCKRCSSERCVLAICCCSLMAALYTLGWLLARHATVSFVSRPTNTLSGLGNACTMPAAVAAIRWTGELDGRDCDSA